MTDLNPVDAMTNLSPAAQAVRNAYHEICEDYIETWLNFNHNRGLAAALRAVAEHCVPDDSEGHWVYIPHVLAIAEELEANAQ
jgi:hypothetical protein